ncbi:hypothetical protein F4815DRAFT_273512 [Daldinia loculata]|nr:hypothetical protein F4815DRAFT_273512 [Daldinia loculata]
MDYFNESRCDPMEESVAIRRRDTIQYCARLLGEPEEDLENLVECCKDKAAEFLRKNGIGSGVGVDYFQWRVDIILWNMMSKLEGAEPCPYETKKPGLCTEPESVEYGDMCDRYTGQLIPAAEWEKRRAQAPAPAPAPKPAPAPAPKPSSISIPALAPTPAPPPAIKQQASQVRKAEIPDISRLSFGNSDPTKATRASFAASLASPPPQRELAQSRPAQFKPAQVRPTETKANEGTGRYVWSQEQANDVWDKVFKGHKKVCNQSGFSVMLPPERSHQKCIVERISRSNQLVDSRYLHIVWIATRNEHGKYAGFKIVLSPVNRTVDIADVLFLHAITVAWDMVWYWLGKMLTSGEDVNFATYNEEYLRQTLAERQDPMSVEERNLTSKQYDDLYFKEIQSVMARKKANREQIRQQENEAERDIVSILRKATNFEGRKEALKKWIGDSANHKLVDRPREFAEKIWIEQSQLFSDNQREISGWFWSLRNAAEPVASYSAEVPAKPTAASQPEQVASPLGQTSKGRANESLEELFARNMQPLSKSWADEVESDEVKNAENPGVTHFD